MVKISSLKLLIQSEVSPGLRQAYKSKWNLGKIKMKKKQVIIKEGYHQEKPGEVV